MADFEQVLREIQGATPEVARRRRQAFFDEEILSDPDYHTRLSDAEREATRRAVLGPEPPPPPSLGASVAGAVGGALREGGMFEPGPIESLGTLLEHYGVIQKSPTSLFKKFPAADVALKAAGLPGRTAASLYSKGESLFTGQPPRPSGMSEGLGTITDVLLGGLPMMPRAAGRPIPPLGGKSPVLEAPSPAQSLLALPPPRPPQLALPPAAGPTVLGPPRIFSGPGVRRGPSGWVLRKETGDVRLIEPPSLLGQRVQRAVPPEELAHKVVTAEGLPPSARASLPSHIQESVVIPGEVIHATLFPSTWRDKLSKVVGGIEIPRILGLTPQKVAEISGNPAFIRATQRPLLAADTQGVITSWFNRQVTQIYKPLTGVQMRRVGKALDGGGLETLSNTELHAASQMRVLLDQAADALRLPRGRRITEYFPHVLDYDRAVVDQTRILSLIPGKEAYLPVRVREGILDKLTESFFMKPRSPKNLPAPDLGVEPLYAYGRGFGRQIALRGGTNPATGEKIPGLLAEIKADLAALPPEHVDFMKAYLDDVLGVPGRFQSTPGLQTLKAIQFLRLIGFNLLSPALNYSQSLNVLALTKPHTWVAAWGDLKNADLVARAKRVGVIDDFSKADFELVRDISAKEMLTVAEGIKAKTLTGIQAVARFSGRGFAKSEKHVRLHGYFVGLRDAAERGLTGTAADEWAKLERVYPAHFKYSREALPASFRKPGYGELMQTFRTYTIGQAQFLGTIVAKDIKDLTTLAGGLIGRDISLAEHPTRTAKWLTANAMLFGPTATLPFGIGAAIADALPKVTPDVIKSGLLPSIGLYIGNQVGLGALPVETLRDLWFFLPGVWVNTISDAASVATYLARKTLPAGAAGPVESQYGTDLSLGPGMGKPMTPDQLAGKITRLIPLSGIMANRLRQALKDLLSETGSQRAETLGQAYTGVPRGGELMERPSAAGRAADFARTLGGVQSPERAARFEQADIERQRSADAAYVTRHAAQLRLMKKPQDALALESAFYQRYGVWPGRSVEALKGAAERSALTPEQRRLRSMKRTLRPATVRERREMEEEEEE